MVEDGLGFDRPATLRPRAKKITPAWNDGTLCSNCGCISITPCGAFRNGDLKQEPKHRLTLYPIPTLDSGPQGCGLILSWGLWPTSINTNTQTHANTKTTNATTSFRSTENHNTSMQSQEANNNGHSQRNTNPWAPNPPCPRPPPALQDAPVIVVDGGEGLRFELCRRLEGILTFRVLGGFRQ